MTPEQETELTRLRETLDAPSAKDAILRAVRIVEAIARQTRRGGQLYVQDTAGQMQRLIIPELESSPPEQWQYLTSRPHPWRRQLWVKGRKLPADGSRGRKTTPLGSRYFGYGSGASMSLRLLLDEDTQAKRLIHLIKRL